MTDAGWQALSQIVGSICGLLAAIFAGKAWKQSQRNECKIDRHEENSAARSAEIQAGLKPPGSG